MKPFYFYSLRAAGLGSATASACSFVMLFVFWFLAAAIPGSQQNLSDLTLPCLVLGVVLAFCGWLAFDQANSQGVNIAHSTKETLAEQERRLELIRAQHAVDLLQIKNQEAALLQAYESRMLAKREES